MRRVKRDQNIYPVILLADVFMNTRFGGRQRPHFMIKRWVRLGDEGGEVEALPPPPAAGEPAKSELPLQEVTEPTIQEDMNDDLPDNLKAEPIPKTAPPHSTARRDLKKPAKTSAKKPPPKRNVLDAG
jgi:hypothetical protein